MFLKDKKLSKHIINKAYYKCTDKQMSPECEGNAFNNAFSLIEWMIMWITHFVPEWIIVLNDSNIQWLTLLAELLYVTCRKSYKVKHTQRPELLFNSSVVYVNVDIFLFLLSMTSCLRYWSSVGCLLKGDKFAFKQTFNYNVIFEYFDIWVSGQTCW